MMREMTAEAVKRAAIRIMIMPTGMLVLRPVSAEIQPLTHTNTQLRQHRYETFIGTACHRFVPMKMKSHRRGDLKNDQMLEEN